MWIYQLYLDQKKKKNLSIEAPAMNAGDGRG